MRPRFEPFTNAYGGCWIDPEFVIAVTHRPPKVVGGELEEGSLIWFGTGEDDHFVVAERPAQVLTKLERAALVEPMEPVGLIPQPQGNFNWEQLSLSLDRLLGEDLLMTEWPDENALAMNWLRRLRERIENLASEHQEDLRCEADNPLCPHCGATMVKTYFAQPFDDQNHQTAWACECEVPASAEVI